MVWLETAEEWSGDDCVEKNITMNSDGTADVECDCDVSGHYAVFLIIGEGPGATVIETPQAYMWEEKVKIT